MTSTEAKEASHAEPGRERSPGTETGGEEQSQKIGQKDLVWYLSTTFQGLQ